MHVWAWITRTSPVTAWKSELNMVMQFAFRWRGRGERERGIAIHMVTTGNTHEKFDQLPGSEQRQQFQIGA
jgi:hypothetical protein